MASQNLPRWALKLFQTSAKKIPAYQAFLKAKNVDPKMVRAETDFTQCVPITHKSNYILKYPEAQRLSTQDQWRPLYASSGSSGTPTFWHLGKRSAEYGFSVHENLFRHGFGILPSEPTLLVVCFGMGIWIAGTFTAQAGFYLAEKGWRVATITPGLDEAALAAVITKFAPTYKHIVLAGFPSYIARMVREHKNTFKSSRAHVHILLAAEAISEAFRDTLLQDLGSPRQSDVLSVYGSADAGAMGFETPFTLDLVRRSLRDKTLHEQLFGAHTSQTPALYQYDSRFIYFENIGPEFALTTESASPLIRYNIHDVGEVISSKQLTLFAKSVGLNIAAPYNRMPAVTYRSRTDVALLYHAINLTASQLSSWFLPQYYEVLHGYFAYTQKTTSGLGERLTMRIATKKRLTHGTQTKLKNAITSALLASSTELRKIHHAFGKRALPTILFVDHPGKLQTAKARKGLLHLGGKKAKVTI